MSSILVTAGECLKSSEPSSIEQDLQTQLTLSLATIVGQQHRIDSLEDTIDRLREDNKALTSTVLLHKNRQKSTG